MRTSALLTCCLLLAALTAAPVAAQTPTTGAATAVEEPVALHTSVGQSQEPTTNQSLAGDNGTSPETIEIRIQEDGDARIVLSKTFPAATEPQRTAFQQVANDFRSGEYDLGFSAFSTVVNRVSTETGREMAITDSGPHTFRTGDVGHLEYRFTWTNFANATEENVTVGSAFRTEEGFWLGELGTDERLILRGPSGYTVAESPSGPEIDDDALIWMGPTTFRPGDLTVTFEESTSSGSFPTATLALVVLLVGLLGISAWRLAARRSENATVGDRIDALLSTAESDSSSSAADADGRDTADDAEQSTDSAPGAEAAGDAEASASAPAGAAGTVDPELLSDEERVEQLLETNGGRMKQADIVTETGWSNAKVSQLLSQMDENDRVDKLRIGRENLITLPDVDVTDQE